MVEVLDRYWLKISRSKTEYLEFNFGNKGMEWLMQLNLDVKS